MDDICRTCACYPFCSYEAEECTKYINYVKNEIKKIGEKYGER